MEINQTSVVNVRDFCVLTNNACYVYMFYVSNVIIILVSISFTYVFPLIFIFRVYVLQTFYGPTCRVKNVKRPMI